MWESETRDARRRGSLRRERGGHSSSFRSDVSAVTAMRSSPGSLPPEGRDANVITEGANLEDLTWQLRQGSKASRKVGRAL